jgi:hypothetical protein
MQWLPKIQWPGLGLTIVATVVPTLGIDMPIWLRWAILAAGIAMIMSPLIEAGLRKLIPSSMRYRIAKTRDLTPLEMRYEPRSPYQSSEIIIGRTLNTVRVGLKALHRTLSNCRIYIDKISPVPPILGGFPILLSSVDFLRPDDPEKLIDIASQWDHVDKWKFSTQPPSGGFLSSSKLQYIDDGIFNIEIKIHFGTGLQKSQLFRIWTENKQLHMEVV